MHFCEFETIHVTHHVSGGAHVIMSIENSTWALWSKGTSVTHILKLMFHFIKKHLFRNIYKCWTKWLFPFSRTPAMWWAAVSICLPVLCLYTLHQASSLNSVNCGDRYEAVYANICLVCVYMCTDEMKWNKMCQIK